MLAEASGPVKGRAGIPFVSRGTHRESDNRPPGRPRLPSRVFHGKPPPVRISLRAPSPERPVSWNSHPPRPTLPRWSRRRQDADSPSLAAAHLRAEQAQLIEPYLRPPRRVGLTRGLAHRQPATLHEKAH